MSRIAAATSWWSRQRSISSRDGRQALVDEHHRAVLPRHGRDHVHLPTSILAERRWRIVRRRYNQRVVTFDEALAIVLGESRALPDEYVALEDALGRVLAEDVRADRPLPPFDRAAMDGFALRAADAAAPGAVLRVVGEVRAGRVAGAARSARARPCAS